MANGIMADGTANGTADETAKLGRQANAAEIFSEIQTASHLVLPSNAIIAYMNEGAANIVFSLTIPRPHQDPENSYRTAVSQSRKNRDGFGFWDGKSYFIHLFMSLSFLQAFLLPDVPHHVAFPDS